MEEAPIEIPTSWWERVRSDKRKLALVVACSVALVAVLAMVAAQLGTREDPRASRRVPVGYLDPASTIPPAWQPGDKPDDESGGTSTRDPVAEGADSGNAPGEPDVSPEPGSSDSSAQDMPAIRRAPLIAYRLDGSVWIADEDGTDAREITRVRADAYALAPDGTVLAVVDGTELVLIDVEAGSRVVVGPAEPRGLVWHPDSSAVVFLRAVDGSYGVTEVFRTSRTGGRTTLVTQGDWPAVARDGTVVALPGDVTAEDPGSSELIVASPGSEPRRISVSGPVAVCEVSPTSIVYAVAGLACVDDQGRVVCEPGVRTISLDGRRDRRLLGPPETLRPLGFDALIVSPDGKNLLYAEVGDDGHSRAWIVALDGGTPIPLTIRRDTYPVSWSADGSSVFFVEGNAFQGEATALMSARADGTGRRLLVEGAVR